MNGPLKQIKLQQSIFHLYKLSHCSIHLSRLLISNQTMNNFSTPQSNSKESRSGTQQLQLDNRTKRTFYNQFELSALIYKYKSCEVCNKKHNEASMVLCDRCQDAYHIRCIGLKYVPDGTWMCPTCKQDYQINRQKQFNKRPAPSVLRQICAKCQCNSSQDFFSLKVEQHQFLAKQIKLVHCASCKQRFHSICFSKRQTSINCQSCQEIIRQSIPKGHKHFKKFILQSKMKIANLKYLELAPTQFGGLEGVPDAGCLPLQQLLSPKKPTDWRIITCYEASLCYALSTRGMIYSDNLVVDSSPYKSTTIAQAHTTTIQKIYSLHSKDEQVYQKFKQGLSNGLVPPIEIKEDRTKGFYIVSTGFIPKNCIIAEYAGELITARESLNMIHNDNIFTLIRNPRSCESLDIAPSQFANIAIFINGINNEAKDSLMLQNVKALKFIYKGIARVIFTASKDINPHQTLYLNYNGDKAIFEYPTSNFVK